MAPSLTSQISPTSFGNSVCSARISSTARSSLTRWPRAVVTTGEPTGTAPSVRARLARVQRHRRAAVLLAGRGGAGCAVWVTPRRPISRSTSLTKWWRCRRDAARIGYPAIRGRPRASVCEVAGRKGQGSRRTTSWTRSSPRRWRKWHRATRKLPGGAEARGRPDRHRRSALLPAEVHADFGDRFRFQEALSFEGETGPYSSTPRCAPATFCASSRSAARPFRFRGGARPRGHGRQLQSEDFWQVLLAASKADSAVEAAVTAGEPAHVPSTRFNWRRPSTTSITSTPSFTSRTAKRKSSCVDDGFLPPPARTHGRHLGIPIPEYM